MSHLKSHFNSTRRIPFSSILIRTPTVLLHQAPMTISNLDLDAMHPDREWLYRETVFQQQRKYLSAKPKATTKSVAE